CEHVPLTRAMCKGRRTLERHKSVCRRQIDDRCRTAGLQVWPSVLTAEKHSVELALQSTTPVLVKVHGLYGLEGTPGARIHEHIEPAVRGLDGSFDELLNLRFDSEVDGVDALYLQPLAARQLDRLVHAARVDIRADYSCALPSEHERGTAADTAPGT